MSPSDADSPGWLGIPWREISWRGMFSKRALVWSGVIVATAIMLHVASPPNPKIAKLDKQPAAGAAAGNAETWSDRSPSDGNWEVLRDESRKPRLGEVRSKVADRKAPEAKDRELMAEARRRSR